MCLYVCRYSLLDYYNWLTYIFGKIQFLAQFDRKVFALLYSILIKLYSSHLSLNFKIWFVTYIVKQLLHSRSDILKDGIVNCKKEKLWYTHNTNLHFEHFNVPIDIINKRWNKLCIHMVGDVLGVYRAKKFKVCFSLFSLYWCRLWVFAFKALPFYLFFIPHQNKLFYHHLMWKERVLYR
jgi:hypothetical protein